MSQDALEQRFQRELNITQLANSSDGNVTTLNTGIHYQHIQDSTAFTAK
jgi:hypothetical protein